MKKEPYRKFYRFIICSLVAVLFSVCVFLAGCSQPKSTTSNVDEKITVAVSIVPQATFVKAVGGDLVDVVTLIPPGSSPANYAPTPQQMEQFSHAKLYFAIGVPAEKANIMPKINDLNKNMQVVDLPSLVDAVYPARKFDSGERDPHMWLSPKRVQEMIKITQTMLTELDPAHKETYAQNAQAYISQLDRLDQEIKASLQYLPAKIFIVYHPAFGYFADDYGLKMVAIEEEGKEAAAEDLQKIIDLARKENIKVVFYQAEVDSKQSRTLAAEIGGQTEMVAPLAPDYIDNLSKTAQTFARVLQQ